MPNTNIIHPRMGTLALLRGLVPRRTVNHHEALRIAELQASRLRHIHGVDTAHFPQEALELPRIRVEFDFALPSSGMTFWDGAAWVIILNAAEARTRQRFSLLHEFKHIVDHTTKQLLYGDLNRHNPAAERAADYFAACVLMPKLFVKRHWGQGPRDLRAMARIFEVSPAAMKYRLDQLGLLADPRRCRWSPDAYQRSMFRQLELNV